MNMMLKLLVYIGLTRKKRNGKWFVPFHTPPKHQTPHSWAALKAFIAWHGWKPYVFRNTHCDPRFHRRKYKRILPFRWGFGWMGFEFGDRGGEHVK